VRDVQGMMGIECHMQSLDTIPQTANQRSQSHHVRVGSRNKQASLRAAKIFLWINDQTLKSQNRFLGYVICVYYTLTGQDANPFSDSRSAYVRIPSQSR
jgi:hypothetical protein